jgi:indole-3-glycerol phosphate synthase/phosphoribosylanthranilate isomerase
MTILDDIFAHKRIEVAGRKQALPLEGIQVQAMSAPPPRDFVAALLGAPSRPALIAEIKRASPSRGLLLGRGALRPFDPVRLARIYQENGAAAISVLTDERFFHGSLDDLRAVRRAVGLPLLRKDFIFDPYQVYEARAAGADAVLLIAAMLDDEALAALHDLVGALGMTPLVEVHDEAELRRVLRLKPRLIGINNRDLRTFKVDTETTARLCPLVPEGVTLVAESGIRTSADVACLAEWGVHAMLVGESLVTAPDPAAKVRELTGHTTRNTQHGSRVPCSVFRVKICGITTLDDALAAIDAGADILGFNFYPKSPRYIAPQACAKIVSALASRGIETTPTTRHATRITHCALRVTHHASRITLIGVFVNSPLAEVKAILDDCGLYLAQLHGDEPPEFVEALDGRAFKGLRPATLEQARAEARRFACRAAPALLVDACRPGAYGGTGQSGDWGLARALAEEYPILLAGGLTPENVAEAVAQGQPWGVDVASGVESSPGHKDVSKMRAFGRAAKAAADFMQIGWGDPAPPAPADRSNVAQP